MTHGKTALLCLILSASCMGQIPVLGSGAGGGSGTITSVTLAGTTNQITATGTCTVTTTGTCTLSLPSGLVLPGTVNGLTITTTTGTLTIASAKVATVNNSLTLAGTDGVTLTFPTTNATIARTDAAQTFTGTQTFSSPIVGSVTGTALSAAQINGAAVPTTGKPTASNGSGQLVDSTAAATAGLWTGTCPSGTTSVLGTGGVNQCVEAFPNAHMHGSILGTALSGNTQATVLVYPFGSVFAPITSCASLAAQFFQMPIGGWMRNTTANISAANGNSSTSVLFVPGCIATPAATGGVYIPPSGAAGGYMDSWSTASQDATHVNQYQNLAIAEFRNGSAAGSLTFGLGSEFISDDGTADTILGEAFSFSTSASSTQYIGFLSPNVSSTEASQSLPIPIAGTLKNLMLANNTSPTANLVVTVNTGTGSGAASNTAITTTITGGDTAIGYYTDITHSASAAAGDFVDIQTTSGATTQAVLKAVSLLFVPTDGLSIIVYGSFNNGTVGATNTYAKPFSALTGTTLATEEFTMPISCNATNLYVYKQTGNGGGITTTYTLFSSSTGLGTPVATALTGTIGAATTGAVAVDTTHTVSLVAGGNISLKYVAAGGTDGANTSWAFACK